MPTRSASSEDSLKEETAHAVPRGAWWAIPLILIAVAIAYANALDNGFVFDDYEMVVDNPQIRSLDNIPKILGVGEGSRRYRPVRFVSYAIDHALFGLEPAGWHLMNIVYHGLCAVLVYLIVLRLRIPGRAGEDAGAGSTTPASVARVAPIALLAALLFAVHPIQTDAVTYVSGRRDVLSTAFYLAGFYAFLRWHAGGTRWWLVGLLVAALLGVFTKEMAITLPALMLAYDWMVRLSGEPRGASLLALGPRALAAILREHYWLYGPVFLLAVAFVVEKTLLNNPSLMDGLYGENVPLHALTVCRIVVAYVALLIWPATLSADYSYNAFPVTASLLEPTAWLAVAVLALILASLIGALRRRPLLAFGGLWFFHPHLVRTRMVGVQGEHSVTSSIDKRTYRVRSRNTNGRYEGDAQYREGCGCDAWRRPRGH